MAVASPIPLEAPVMMATFPRSGAGMVVIPMFAIQLLINEMGTNDGLARMTD